MLRSVAFIAFSPWRLAVLCWLFTTGLRAALPEYPLVQTWYLPGYVASGNTGALAALTDGRLAMGTEEGLLILSGRKTEKLPLETEVLALLTVGSRTFVGGYEELGYVQADAQGRLRYTSLNTLLGEEAANVGEVRQVLAAGAFVYFITETAVYRYLPLVGDLQKLSTTGTIRRAAVHQQRQLVIWLDQQGPATWNGKQWQPLSANPENTTIEPTAAAGNGAQTLWLNAAGQVRIQEKSGFRNIQLSQAELLNRNGGVRHAAALDQWLVVGTPNAGLWVYDKATGALQTQLTTLNGLPENEIIALWVDPAGGIWMQHRSSLSRWNPYAQVSDYRAVAGLNGSINAIRWHQGQLHIATENGLYSLTRTTTVTTLAVPAAASQPVPGSGAGMALPQPRTQAATPAAGQAAQPSTALAGAGADIPTEIASEQPETDNENLSPRERRRQERLARKRKQEAEAAERERKEREALRSAFLTQEAAQRVAREAELAAARPAAAAAERPRPAPPVNYLIQQSGQTSTRVEYAFRAIPGLAGRTRDLAAANDQLFALSPDGVHAVSGGAARKVAALGGRKLVFSTARATRAYLLQDARVVLLEWNGSELIETGEVVGDLPYFSHMAEDAQGNLYIGGRGGLLFAAAAAQNAGTRKASLHKPGKLARYAVVRFAGEVWVQSAEQVWHLKTAEQLDPAPFLQAHLGKEALLFPAENGVYSLRANKIYHVHLKSTSLQKVDTLHAGSLFAEPFQQMAVGEGGQLWLATNRWVAQVGAQTMAKPASGNSAPLVAQTHLLSLAYRTPEGQDSLLPIRSPLKLSYDRYGFTARFFAPSWEGPDRWQAQYRLAADQPWQDLDEDRFRFSNSAEGPLQVELRVMTAEGIPTVPVRYELVVRPPWYRTIWFYGLLLVLTVGGVVAFVRYRSRELLRRNAELETKVQERTAQIQQQMVELQDKNSVILKQKSEIEHQSHEILESIQYAQRIQQAILPKPEQLREIFDQFFVLYKPRDVVSGDFYWYLREGDRVYFAAGDCTGHGVPGALMSMIGSTLLNQIVGQNMATDPGSVLQKLHLGVQSALQQTQSTGNDKVRDGMELVLCELDLGAQRLRVASANRPFYLIDQGELVEYKGDKVPIGGASAPHSYQNLDISLRKGVSLYLFSDGYPDQFGGPDNRKFQTKRFKQLLVDIAALELPTQCERLEQELELWRGGTQQIDDVLVMGMRF